MRRLGGIQVDIEFLKDGDFLARFGHLWQIRDSSPRCSSCCASLSLAVLFSGFISAFSEKIWHCSLPKTEEKKVCQISFRRMSLLRVQSVLCPYFSMTFQNLACLPIIGATRTWDVVVKISSPFFQPIKYQIPIRTQKCTHDNKGLHTVRLKCIKVSIHFHSTVWPKSPSLRM